MSEQPGLIHRLLASMLLATAVGVTGLLLIIGYEMALWILENGHTQGQTSMAVLAGMPSLCAALSWPFWMTFWRMKQRH